MNSSEKPPDRPFRWQALFQQAAEPLFLLSARRRLLFANRAWEACTGLALAEVRGRPCRRAPGDVSRDPEAALLAALAPPPEALGGDTCEARRRAPGTNAGW